MDSQTSEHVIHIKLQPLERIDRRIRATEIQRPAEQSDEIEDHITSDRVEHAEAMLRYVAPLIYLVVIEIG